MPVDWDSSKLEQEVEKKERTWLTKLAITGETQTKLNITKLGRVKDNIMRGEMTWELHPTKLIARWGNNVKYTIYQELGTVNEDGSQRIKPGFFLRNSLRFVKSKADKVKV